MHCSHPPTLTTLRLGSYKQPTLIWYWDPFWRLLGAPGRALQHNTFGACTQKERQLFICSTYSDKVNLNRSVKCLSKVTSGHLPTKMSKHRQSFRGSICSPGGGRGSGCCRQHVLMHIGISLILYGCLVTGQIHGEQVVDKYRCRLDRPLSSLSPYQRYNLSLHRWQYRDQCMVGRSLAVAFLSRQNQSSLCCRSESPTATINSSPLDFFSSLAWYCYNGCSKIRVLLQN